MDKNPTLWLIPARGGSKGIPDKNIKPFLGKSLVARAVEQALQCMAPGDVVFVSTDSSAIKKEAEKCGVEVPFMRPDLLASDTASSYDVIIHAIKEFEKQGKFFSKVVLLQPTSPLRNADDINGALRLWTPDIDMVVTVCEAATNPYYNAFETDSEGFLHISKGDGKYTRRQDVPKVWEYNGAVYVMTVDSLKKKSLSSFARIIPYAMDRTRSIDLDTPTDWIIAEIIFSRMSLDQ